MTAVLRREIAALARIVAAQGKRITALETELCAVKGGAERIAKAEMVLRAGQVPAVLAAPILAQVADAHGLTPDDLRGPSRVGPAVIARRHAMAALSAAGASTTAIGRALNRDHTTVSHGLRRWAEMQGAGQ